MSARAGVSVLVCTRNRPDMLRCALASIQRFTDDSVEVLVVDSASTSPSTRDVALQSGSRYIRADRPGLSIARNLGLREATGDIVVFTDDDCEVGINWLEPIVRHFADWQVGAVSGRMLDPGSPTAPRAEHLRRAYTRTAQGLDAGHGALMAFDRAAVLEIGGFDELLGAGRYFAGSEDLDMFCRILRTGWTIVHEPAAAVVHLNQRRGADYVQLLNGYGLGLGAMVGKFLRIDPVIGLPLGTLVTYRTARRALRHALTRNGLAAGDWAMLRGILTGAAKSTGVKISGERFNDPHPPAEIPAVGADPQRELAS